MTTHFVGGWAIDSENGPVFRNIALIGGTVPAGAFYLGGAAYASDGARYCSTAAVPAGACRLGGISHTADGAVCIVNTLPSPAYQIGEFLCASDGALYVNPNAALSTAFFAGALQFASDGGLISRTGDSSLIWEFDSSTLSLTPTIGTGTPIVTRAGNTATRVNSSGFIEVVNADLPRFDYDPVTLALRGLLVEEARTNLLLRSAEFDNAAWIASGTGTTTANSTAAPDGAIAADTLEDTSAANFYGRSQSVVITADAVVRCASIYVLKDSVTTRFPLFRVVMGANNYSLILNTSTGAVIQFAQVATAYGSQDAGDYWRIWVAGANDGAGALATCEFFPAANTVHDSSITVTALGAATIWGAQLEVGAFPTSYIPTTTTTVTRNADVATLATSLIPGFSATGWSMYAEAYAAASTGVSPSDFVIMNLDDGTTNERTTLSRANQAAVAAASMTDGGASQASYNGQAWAQLALHKLAMAVAANDVGFASAGVAGTTDTLATLPTVTTLRVGAIGGSPLMANAPIRKLRLYSARKSNTALVSMTS